MNELEQAVAQVVARLAHDLRNPLAVVLSNLRYLRMSTKDREDLEAIQESLFSADRLDRILNDMVDLQRLRGGLSGASATFSVAELEQVLRDKLALQIGRRSLEVQLPDVQLRVDRALLRRVLLNILEHALRNTPTAGVVRLRGEVVQGALELRVIDGGAAFAADRPASFVTQELTSRAAPPDGCRSDQGLGLHFAGVAARALGARTDLTPRTDGEAGVAFILTFPEELVT
jgi:signal transduction histidine kinase